MAFAVRMCTEAIISFAVAAFTLFKPDAGDFREMPLRLAQAAGLAGRSDFWSVQPSPESTYRNYAAPRGI
jgi:hypothetical protein